MTATDAAKKLVSYNKKLDIQLCKDYGKFFCFLAPEQGDIVNMDPFYLVEKSTGKIESFSIAADPNRFYSAKEVKFIL